MEINMKVYFTDYIVKDNSLLYYFNSLIIHFKETSLDPLFSITLDLLKTFGNKFTSFFI